MFRNRKTKIGLCLSLIAAVLLLKLLLPKPGACVGSWISGLGNPEFSRAVSVFYERLSQGDRLTDAAEVFHEELP